LLDHGHSLAQLLQLLPHRIHAALDLRPILVRVLRGAVMCLVRASALIVSVVAVGSPGIGVSLFVEQLLPGLDPVAHGHGVWSFRSGRVEIDLFSRARVSGQRRAGADLVAGWVVKGRSWAGGRGAALVVQRMPRLPPQGTRPQRGGQQEHRGVVAVYRSDSFGVAGVTGVIPPEGGRGAH
jgi:hypothetical protein